MSYSSLVTWSHSNGSGCEYILNNSLNIKLMNEFIDIIVIYIVFRAIIAFLGAWWHGDGRNDFRRNR